MASATIKKLIIVYFENHTKNQVSNLRTTFIFFFIKSYLLGQKLKLFSVYHFKTLIIYSM